MKNFHKCLLALFLIFATKSFVQLFIPSADLEEAPAHRYAGLEEASAHRIPSESITLKLAAHTANAVVLPYGPLTPLDAFLRCHDEKKQSKFTSQILIQSSLGPHNETVPSLIPYNSGFLSTVMQAYNDHQNLVIRPDDIWLAILMRFSAYINKNAEEHRSQFVAHEGKREVMIYKGGNRFSNNWGNLSQDLVEAMDKFLVDETLKPWILPNFTTTAEPDVSVASVIMLNTFKEYFGYKVVLGCGLPSVTLMGTRADWVDVLRRIQRLHLFDIQSDELRLQNLDYDDDDDLRYIHDHSLMKDWEARLVVLMQRFIRAFDGEIDEDFWSRIVTKQRYGSGDQIALTGWVTALASFNPEFSCEDSYELDGVKFGCMDIDDLPVDIVEVPIKIDDNGYQVVGLLAAGILGARKLGNTTLGFERAWWIFENKKRGWF